MIRVSGSVGRVTERFRVPLVPALTRLPDTVTSVIREYPPRAVSPFSLKRAARRGAARPTGMKTFARDERREFAEPWKNCVPFYRFLGGLVPVDLFPRNDQFRLH